MVTPTIKAIKSLLGNAEWSISDDDLSTLVIHTVGINAPTAAEIEAEIKKLNDIEARKEAARSALLARLGITEEEARLLLG